MDHLDDHLGKPKIFCVIIVAAMMFYDTRLNCAYEFLIINMLFESQAAHLSF